MKRLYSSVIGGSIVSERSGKHLATIDDVVLDHNSGRILALKVRKGFLFIHNRIVMLQDIRHIDGENFYVESSQMVIPSSDVVRLHKLLPKTFSWLHLPVYSKSNKMIGRVEDIVLELMLGQVVRLYVKKDVFSMITINSFIIPFERIEKITKKKIIINEDVRGYKLKQALMRNIAKIASNTVPAKYGRN
jgi:uncharacterized protein YrrD